ncbi:hypothetical protein CKA32_003365 [Geitlerinema sp. FC II]|nr:hypothetical protein CKA32_003365 [Geitlerinema sp. FC II]
MKSRDSSGEFWEVIDRGQKDDKLYCKPNTLEITQKSSF